MYFIKTKRLSEEKRKNAFKLLQRNSNMRNVLAHWKIWFIHFFHSCKCYFSLSNRAISEYLSKDLPYKLSPDNIYVTLGCNQAVEVVLSVLARPNANILLPRPGFPTYEARAAFNRLEVRHFDLLPEKGWEVDLDAVEAIADENTVAMVIINP